MEVEIIFDEFKAKAEKSIKAFKAELLVMKAGRANAHILDKVQANYYGTPTPINQMANITVPEARVLQISVWDVTAMKAVEKALIDANLGITPTNDGKVIRLIFPELTEERRKSLVKDIKTLSETTKVAVRNIRREAIEQLRVLKKDSTITEDELHNYEKDADKLTSEQIADIDKIATDKEKEIMCV